MANKDDHKMRCSFCGKPQDMVYKLITGPGVCICDECVELCNSILYDEEDMDPLEKTKRKKQEERGSQGAGHRGRRLGAAEGMGGSD